MGNENSQAITFFPVKQKGGHQNGFGMKGEDAIALALALFC
jgi:hypothetical protein